jgi:hypothetical protein
LVVKLAPHRRGLHSSTFSAQLERFEWDLDMNGIGDVHKGLCSPC